MIDKIDFFVCFCPVFANSIACHDITPTLHPYKAFIHSVNIAIILKTKRNMKAMKTGKIVNTEGCEDRSTPW